MSGWYPPPSRPRPVEGGLKARSRRGAIGETWWSRRFIDLLESFRLGGRLDRGRRYARAGQVLDLQVAAGLVSARVQGSRVRPYRVRLETPVLAAPDWERVEQAMAGRAAFAARLLAGEMPHDIEEAFAAAGVSLFPASPRNLASSCSCPDWSNPCKHVAAVYYLLAEAFDDDPFLVLAWRGRDREQLLDALRGTPEPLPEIDPLAVEEEPLDARLIDFYAPAVSLSRLRERPARITTPPELLLRALDPPPVKVRHIPLVDLLRPAYRSLETSE